MFCDHAGVPEKSLPFHVQTVLAGHCPELADAGAALTMVAPMRASTSRTEERILVMGLMTRTIVGWLWYGRGRRTLVDMLSGQLGKADPVRTPEVSIARWMYPLEHRHMN